MSTDQRRAARYLHELLGEIGEAELLARLRPRPGPPAPSPRPGAALDDRSVARRWAALGATESTRAALLDPWTADHLAAFERHIENFIGSVKLPVGVAGPLRVNGLFAEGDYLVPLATSEAALVASYDRGARLITAAGGCAAVLLEEGVGRAPGFAFATIAEAGRFLVWALESMDAFREVVAGTTRHGRLKDLRVTVEGNHVYLHFEYTTGDAAGQNMVTLATDALCRYIREHAPVQPRYQFLEANLSGDKKASAQSFLLVRGRKVSAEVTVPATLVGRALHTTPARMTDYWRMSAMGGVLSGTLGVHGHYANGLAALYIACGQDPACVAESAVGVTRMELTGAGDLYAAVTLPNLMVGTVGGGTTLPSQQACLRILGLAGSGHARALAEVAAALCLAGELSIIGALAADHFARAHRRLARGRDG
jgi:hydroxymethylglutaryl-CoA reductase (NADPH)